MKICKTCYWFRDKKHIRGDVKLTGDGICIANPPVPMLETRCDPPALIALYPLVKKKCMCSLWKGLKPIDELAERINDE